MERLRQMLRRKAGQVAPEPEGKNIRLSQEASGPSVPTGGEEAGGQHKERSCLACWSRWTTPAPLADPEAPSGPKCRWPLVQLRRREPGEGRSRARQLWGSLQRKPSSQELHPRAQQQPPTTMAPEEPCASPILATQEPPASPTLATQESPASPEQEMSNCGPNPCSSAYSRGASSSSAESHRPEVEGSLFAEPPSAHEDEEEEEDVSLEEETIREIQQYLQGRDELVQDRANQLRFLDAVLSLCVLAQQQGRDTLEPHMSKEALVETIAELIEHLPVVAEPSSVISSSMAAVYKLSKLKPPLSLELESRLLRALLHQTFTMGTGNDTPHFRALHKSYSQSLDIMLRGLLTETPSLEKLQHLLEHVHVWLQSKRARERARAIRSSAALLEFASSLPGFDTSSDFSKAGDFVLQLGLHVAHPANDISQQARVGIHGLHRLLVQKRGLNITVGRELWCQDKLQDTERVRYKNLARVGEVFGEIFTEDQKKTFLQAALQAIDHPQIRVSQPGLMLTYSILGKAGQLIGDEEEIAENVMHELFEIKIMRQVPKALEGLCSGADLKISPPRYT